MRLPLQLPDNPPNKTMKRHDQELQEEKTRMGFCKIKGDGTADATSRCLHVNEGGTPRPWAIGETLPDCTRCVLTARAICAGLRRATKTHGHGSPRSRAR